MNRLTVAVRALGAVGVAFACGACATTSPPVNLRADSPATDRLGAAITLSRTAVEALRQIAGIPECPEMQLVVFDLDGTLVQTFSVDEGASVLTHGRASLPVPATGVNA